MWVAVRAQYQVERAQVQCAVQQVRMQNARLGEYGVWSTLVGEEGVADWKLGWAVNSYATRQGKREKGKKKKRGLELHHLSTGNLARRWPFPTWRCVDTREKASSLPFQVL